MRSVVYWHPAIYAFFMNLGYGKAYEDRYRIVSSLIEPNSSVVDVCGGDCRIFSYLKKKNIDYTSLDFNPVFVRAARKKGIKVNSFDVNKDSLPKADYILMQGSLYQFFPRHQEILGKLFDAAQKYLIISEPVKNKAHSKSKIISFIGLMLSDPGDGLKKFKFNINTFREALEPLKKNIVKEEFILNGIECVVLIKK